MRTSTIKSIAALALTGAGSALVLGFRTSDGAAITPATRTGSGTAGNATTTGSGSGSGPTSTAGGGSTTTASYHDGTWTGSAISEPWGPFQVQVVISGGKITNVSVVESPSDRHSSRINNQAVPMLTQATLADQGSSVDMVSGATWTSDSYANSLQSALDQAAQGA
jgi:uncharacterized protein with FMN-binding domain